MILQGLRAQNVLKYARLVVNGIPEKGLIAISGRNESGKTAIVESICFALFGRTFSVPESRPEQIIRWNEPGCQIELQFRGEDDKTYRIERSLDYKGTHAALLFRRGEEEPFASGPHSVNEAVYGLCGFDFSRYLDALYLAQREISTPHSQSETIKAIAGATELEVLLDELKRDIENEQGRIRSLDTEVSETIRQINELDVSDQVLADMEQERHALHKRIHDAEQAVDSLNTAANNIQADCPGVQSAGKAIATAHIDSSLKNWADMIDTLESRIRAMCDSCEGIETDSELCAEHSKLSEHVSELGDRLNAFERVQDRMDFYRMQLAALLAEDDTRHEGPGTGQSLPVQRRDVSRLVRQLTLKNVACQVGVLSLSLLSLGSLFVWFQSGTTLDPAATEWLLGVLEQVVGTWGRHFVQVSHMATAGFAIAAGLCVFYSMNFSRHIRELKGQRDRLQAHINELLDQARLIDDADGLPLPGLVADLKKLNNGDISQQLTAFTEGAGLPFVSQPALTAEQDRLLDILNACMNNVGDLRESIAIEIGHHQRIIEESQERNTELDAEKEQVRRREEEISQLRDRIDGIATRKVQHEEHIGTLELARHLIRETCRNIYNRFNQVLSKYTGMVMPRLTDDRYKQMQIADDLSVRVFSQDKNDFGELEEFSSGTQRQILLAVRLAMSKALIEAVNQGKQFIILDEPFAFFDRERVQATLKALPKVDKNLDQIWIITQEFADTQLFALHIECSRDSDELIIGQPAQ